MNFKEIEYRLRKTPIAIIGMGGVFPRAKNLSEFWHNIIKKVDCITDVPPSRWNIDDYYDTDIKAPDKTYSKRGGFIPDIEFDPMEFGLPPNILEVTDVSQLLALAVAKETIRDAGYGEDKEFDRDHTGVILGVGGGQKLITPLTSRLQYPIWERALKKYGIPLKDIPKIIETIKSAYIKWEENSFPGLLGNIIAGRVANRFNLGGVNCVVDAACAASLAAFRMAVSELVEYRHSMMITGGVDTDNSIFMYLSFSKTPAFSVKDDIRPFDIEGDGMLIGEAVGMLALKRLEDAERDKDRIYAVVKGMGASSDGRAKSIYAPSPEGQMKALKRAYEEAGFSPSSVGLIEAHGTGTITGDPAEFEALNKVFGENNNRKMYIALGSVKSQIGHTKSAAGAVSLIKTALSLYHKILPPTINVTKPNPKLKMENSPFYLNTDTKSWIKEGNLPRRAGVSAFGFGGADYHVTLEEYEGENREPRFIGSGHTDAKTKKKGLTVTLNGSNYISPKTKEAFKNSLEELNKDENYNISDNYMKGEPMDAHAEYLKTMAETSRTYSEMIRHYYTLLADSKNSFDLLKNFENALNNFHEYQMHIQQNHKIYLASEADYEFSPVSSDSVPEIITTRRIEENEEIRQIIHEEAPAVSISDTVSEEPKKTEKPAEVKKEPETPVPSGFDTEKLKKTFLEVVSDKTGYPVDALDLDMELEADLGIDSIKRVEIMGAMQELFSELPPIKPEDMAEMQTLAQIIEYMKNQIGQGKKNSF